MAEKEGVQKCFTRRNRWKKSEDELKVSHNSKNGQAKGTSQGRDKRRQKRDDRDIYDKQDVDAPFDEAIDSVSNEFIQFTITASTESKCSFDSLSKDMECLTNDGGVKKKVLMEGAPSSEDQISVDDGCRVWYHYETYGENSTPYCIASSNQMNCAAALTIGDASLLGLYVGLRSMKKKEIAEFLLEPMYAYGNLGVPDFIQPSKTVK